MFSLAEKTGWSVDYILWELPLALMTQASHAYLWMNGVKCRKVGGVAGEELVNLEKLLGLT